MANLDRLVVRDFLLIESATWWKDCPEVESGELSPETNENEAFWFSAAAHTEKSGSVTNTNRMQWHDEAVEPEGDARSDVWFMYTSAGSSATNGAHTWGNVTVIACSTSASAAGAAR